jgi:2-iminobutanoate/2-iminopropanoate deaminase
MSHRAIHTDHAPAALGPYSQAIALPLGDRELIFLAGQIPLIPETGELVAGPVAGQVEQVMRNLGAVLEAAGVGFDRVVKTTIFLETMDDFAAVNEVYGTYFGDTPPARATVAVRGLPKGVQVEIEAVAYR